MATRTLTVNLVGRTKSLERAFDRSSKSAGSMASGIAKATKTASKALLGLGGVFAGAAFAAKPLVDAAVDVQESLSKNVVVFGKAAEGVAKFADTAADAMGMSRRQALEATGTFGTLAAAMKIPEQQAADMSVTMTALAADMASFNNASPEETLLALQSGLRGEAEPLRRFGVLLDAATLKAEALKQGLVDNEKTALTPVQKALAAYNVILEQTKIQQGDFERTSDGLANTQRTLSANFEDVKEKLGTLLMPAFEAAAAWLGDTGLPAIEGFVDGIGGLGDNAFVSGVADNLGELWDRIGSGLSTIADSDKWGDLAEAFEAIPGWATGALQDLDAIDWSDVSLDELLDTFGGIASELDVIMQRDVLPGIGALGGSVGAEFTMWLGRSIGDAMPGIAADAAAAFDFTFKTNFSQLFGEDATGATAQWIENTGMVWMIEQGLSFGIGFLDGITAAFSGVDDPLDLPPHLSATRDRRPRHHLEAPTLLGSLASELFGKSLGDLDVGERAEVEGAAAFIAATGPPAAPSPSATVSTLSGQIVINMPPGADGNDVVAALTRWSQQNGPLPAGVTGN